MTLAWTPREQPLTPVGLVALGDDARALRARLLRLDGATLAHLRGVTGPGLLALLGPHEWLPWSGGVRYLGSAPTTPQLLLPTTHTPSVSDGLLLETLQERFPALALPLACLPQCVFSVADAATLTPEALRHA